MRNYFSRIAIILIPIIFVIVCFYKSYLVHVHFLSPKKDFLLKKKYVYDYNLPLIPPLHCVPFLTISGVLPICVHDNKNEYITRDILIDKQWEKPLSNMLENILVSNPDCGIVDIGANLGMFSILGANLKRPALAVEALDINIGKFHQSIVVNRFQGYITLVTRPLSDKHEVLQMAAGVRNLGRSRLIKGQRLPGIFKHRVYREKNKTALLLDELIELYPWKKAVMVIDVEGNEGKVMRGAEKFFDALDITHVFMEWLLLPAKERAFLVQFFIKRNYKPHQLKDEILEELVVTQYRKWPVDVVWKKNV